MSNHLAIAMVTAVLSRMLSEAVAAASPGGVENAGVTTLRPQTLAAAETGARGINVYLYRTVPNGGWSSTCLPTRRSDGAAVAPAGQAVDLHYLLTFSGDDGLLEPQRLLGVAVTALARRPVLSGELIRRTVAQAVDVDPHAWQQYADLGRQPDVVRLTLLPLDVEELTKLWGMLFHSPYRLSLAYQATAVLLEAQEESPAAASPVRGRVITLDPATAAANRPASGPGGLR